MSDTPGVSRSRDREIPPPSEAVPLASPQDTPTVEFRGRPGKGNPLRIDEAPTQDHSRNDPGGIEVPSPFAADVPSDLTNHPRYRVLGMLGKGGMGIVYKAEHRVMKRFVALKVIGAHLVAEPAALARFRREVEAAAKLSHPNIVTAYDAEQAGDCHFLVMELVDGISFDLVLKRKGPLPLVFACDYMRQAALGLQHAYEHSMVHRDIKPQNLMLTRKGQVKILDFGLARFASENGPTTTLTECGALTGTPDFMSPEQAEDARKADIRADIYSLGCTFYTLLTGQLPFPGGSYVEKVVGHLKKEPAPLTDLRSDLPPELVRIVGRMMAKDADQRFRTPDEVAKVLLAFRKTGAAMAEPVMTDSKSANRDVSPVTGDSATLTSQQYNQGIQPSEEVPSARPSRSRTKGRRHRSSAGRNWKPVAIGAAIGLFGLLSLVGGLLLLVLSRSGKEDKNAEPSSPTPSIDIRTEEQAQVRVVSMDPFLELVIRRGPKEFGTLSPNNNPELILPAGEYEVQVVGGAPELRGFSTRFSLAKGDRKIIEGRREGIFVRDFAANFPPPPGRPGGPPPPPFGGRTRP